MKTKAKFKDFVFIYNESFLHMLYVNKHTKHRTALHGFRLIYDDSGVFLVKEEVKPLIIAQRHMNILTTKNVIDTATGLSAIYVVIGSISNVDNALYIVKLSNGSFKMCRKIQPSDPGEDAMRATQCYSLPPTASRIQTESIPTSVSITDGPSLCFICQNDLHVFTFVNTNIQAVSLNITNQKSKKTVILSTCLTLEENVIVLCRIHEGKSDTHDDEFVNRELRLFYVTMNNDIDYSPQIHCLPVSFAVPDIYKNIITDLVIQQASVHLQENINKISDDPRLEDMDISVTQESVASTLKSTFVSCTGLKSTICPRNFITSSAYASLHDKSFITVDVCTCMGQLLHINTGKIKKCMTLQHQNAIFITSFHSFNQDDYIIVGDIDDISVINKDTFQVLKTLKNGPVVCVGDFISNGAEQLLIINSLPKEMQLISSFVPKDFLITDFSGVLLNGSNKHDETPSDAVSAATHSLTARLQTDRASLHECKYEMECKHQLILDGCKHLSVTSHSGKAEIAQPDSLVHLCGRAATNLPPPGPVSSDGIVDIVCVWQRLVDGQWVLGVDLLNLDHCSMISPSILPVHHLLFDGSLQNEEQFSQHLYVWTERKPRAASITTQLSPKSKKQKTHRKVSQTGMCLSAADVVPPGAQASVVLACQQGLRLSVQGKHKVSVWLNWCAGKNNHEDVHKINTNTQRFQQRSISKWCGTVDISVDALPSEISIENFQSPRTPQVGSSQDWLAACCVCLHQTTLDLKSTFGEPLAPPVERTLASLGFVHQVAGQCYMCCTSGPLKWCRVEVRCPSGTTTAQVVLWTRNDVMALLLIQLLHGKLPETVTLQPTEQLGQGSDSTGSLRKALTEEITSLKSHLNTALEAAISDTGNSREKISTTVNFQNSAEHMELQFHTDSNAVRHAKV